MDPIIAAAKEIAKQAKKRCVVGISVTLVSPTASGDSPKQVAHRRIEQVELALAEADIVATVQLVEFYEEK